MEALTVYSRHTAAETVTRAFAKGSGWTWTSVKDYKEGPIAIYGLGRGLLEVLHTAQRGGHDWTYLDHGYLNPGHYDGYYSVTKNAFQHTGEGDYDSKRLGPIRPVMSQMRCGEHILLLPPSRLLAPFIDMDVDAWIETYRDLPTERAIRVREKGDLKPLEDDLKDCHAVVTYNSKAAIKASCQGISVFATDPCCITRISQPMLSIDNPDLNIDREGWLRALSYNQWTLDEMRNGIG